MTATHLTTTTATDPDDRSMPWRARTVEIVAREGFIVIFAVWAMYLATCDRHVHDPGQRDHPAAPGGDLRDRRHRHDHGGDPRRARHLLRGDPCALRLLRRGVGGRWRPSRSSASPSRSRIGAVSRARQRGTRQLRANPVGGGHARHAGVVEGLAMMYTGGIEHLRRQPRPAVVPRQGRGRSASRSRWSSPSRCTRSRGSSPHGPASAPTSTPQATTARRPTAQGIAVQRIRLIVFVVAGMLGRIRRADAGARLGRGAVDDGGRCPVPCADRGDPRWRQPARRTRPYRQHADRIGVPGVDHERADPARCRDRGAAGRARRGADRRRVTRPVAGLGTR